jgi:hypothetical protein
MLKSFSICAALILAAAAFSTSAEASETTDCREPQ